MHILKITEAGQMVALGWTLLHFCWQGTLFALLYAAVDRLTLRATLRTRYGIAMITLLLMPLTASITFFEQRRLMASARIAGVHTVISQLGTMHGMIVHAFPFATPAVTRSELWITWHSGRLLPWVDTLWLIGVLLLAVRAFGGWFQLEHIRRRATRAVPQELQQSFDRLSHHLLRSRRVALRISDEVISPLAMGVWRTAIIVPVSAVMQLAPEQLEAVLAHELAHIRRWDYLCNLLQTAIECLLFFHPAVWWMSHRSRDLRELCCDEVAAASCTHPVIYAEALLQLEEQRAAHLQLATALHGSGGSLLGRVKQVLGESMTTDNKSTMSGMRVTVAIAVIATLLLGPKVANGLKVATHTLHKTILHKQAVVAPAPVLKPAPMSPAPMVTIAAVVPNADVAVRTTINAHMAANVETAETISAQQDGGNGKQYLEGMRAVGYDFDLNKDLDVLISMRSVGVTPQYARQMASLGYGKPSAHDLISLKTLDVTPEYINDLKAQGFAPKDLHEAVSDKSLGVTPAYAKQIAALGYGTPNAHDLMNLKALGVDADYIAQLKSAGITPKDLHELGNLKAIGITPEYAKQMAASGFANLPPHELSNLKAVGMTPEQARWLKQTFPNITEHDLQQAAVFSIDADFMAKAKSHGFNDNDFNKLVRLKMSGLLD